MHELRRARPTRPPCPPPPRAPRRPCPNPRQGAGAWTARPRRCSRRPGSSPRRRPRRGPQRPRSAAGRESGRRSPAGHRTGAGYGGPARRRAHPCPCRRSSSGTLSRTSSGRVPWPRGAPTAAPALGRTSSAPARICLPRPGQPRWRRRCWRGASSGSTSRSSSPRRRPWGRSGSRAPKTSAACPPCRRRPRSRQSPGRRDPGRQCPGRSTPTPAQ
mmetsp:Transcript_107577/g.304112  ORF Transcript_107577/g.304112 Transcript_107577/m.304112 type:complete len:216 (-) Transcript_107577:276-923(-)